jgi:hypothetical protein
MGQTQSASLSGLVICACRGKNYNARDLIDSAAFRGELDSSWKQFLIGLKAEERAEELELELDHDAIDAAAELFRYEHDLITAEETERWLAARSLSLEDFTDYFARQHWRSAIDEKIEPNDVDLISAQPELRELFVTELIFSGELDQLNTRLMWRLAALVASGDGHVDPERIGAEGTAFLDRAKITKSEMKEWLTQIGRDEKWLEEMLAMEAAYRSLCEKVLTPEARQKQLASLRMPLTQFEAEVIELESRDAAMEAMLCVRQDGMSMEEVATEARYPYRQVTFLHAEVPDELKQKFWSARAGEVLDPLPRADGFELYRITKKTEPDPSDPKVQARIDAHLLERQISTLTSEHVEMRLGAPLLTE